MKKAILASFLLVLTLSASTFAAPEPAQARLSFTGGVNSTPLSVTLHTPLKIEIHGSKPAATGFQIVFVDVLPPMSGANAAQASSDITRAFTGEPLLPLTHLVLWNTIGNANGDLSFINYGEFVGTTSQIAFNAGDTVELSAGTVTTLAPYSLPWELPVEGLYDVYLATSGGSPISATITAVPEPSTYALIAGGLVFAGVMIRRRKQRNKAA